MNRRLLAKRTFESAISTILDDARALNGAEFGNLQLCVDDRLLIVRHHGFAWPFLHTFREVARHEGTACGRALKSGRTILVEDVELDEEFAPYRSVARAAGFRSVVTTPLLTSRGHVIGAVSTHFARVHRPTILEIAAFEQYSEGASNYLWDLLGERTLSAIALEMSDRLYAAAHSAPIGETRAPC